MESAPHRVLFIDDDADMCALAQVALGARGYSVEWCTSEDQALDKLQQGRFDAVVTDLRLGELGGIGLCERIVADRPDLPVVILTGDAAADSAARAAGARSYLVKPVEMDALADALAEAVATKPAIG